jgi:peptidylprolyl isomerase
MSKNIVPFAIVLLVLLAGVGGILFLSNQGPSSQNQNPLDLIPTLFPTTSAQISPTTAPVNPAIISPQSANGQEAATGASMDNITTQPDGLKIVDEKLGEGNQVKSGDTVTVNYLGTLENGTKFDSSYDRNAPFTTQIGVGLVIKGWDEGIVGMKVGGKRKLIIPASLGYGDRSAGSIPPNSTLIFEVELVAIK